MIKVFEKIVIKNITSYLSINDLFNPNQHGFRKGHSCLSELLAHYEDVLASLEKDACVDVVYLDFKKAFDKVDFCTLLNKIKSFGIGG